MISKDLVLWLRSPEIKVLLSMISTVSRYVSEIVETLWCFIRFLSIRQAEASKSNKAWTFIVFVWKFIWNKTLEQQKVSKDRIWLDDMTKFVSSTVLNMVGRCCFLTQFSSVLANKCLNCIKICATLALEDSQCSYLSSDTLLFK